MYHESAGQEHGLEHLHEQQQHQQGQGQGQEQEQEQETVFVQSVFPLLGQSQSLVHLILQQWAIEDSLGTIVLILSAFQMEREVLLAFVSYIYIYIELLLTNSISCLQLALLAAEVLYTNVKLTLTLLTWLYT